MIPKHIGNTHTPLLCSVIIKEASPQKQMGTNPQTYRQVQRMRNLKSSPIKGMSPPRLSPQGSETMGKERKKTCERRRGWKTPSKQDPLRQHGYHTKTEAACTWSANITNRSLVYAYYSFQFSVVFGILECVNN